MSVSEEIKLHLKLAEEALASANVLLELGYYRDAISRAYYSIVPCGKSSPSDKRYQSKKAFWSRQDVWATFCDGRLC